MTSGVFSQELVASRISEGVLQRNKPDMGYPVTTSKPSQTAAQTRTDGLFGGVQGMIGSASHEKIERTAARKCQDRRSRFNAGCRFPIMAGHGRWVLFNGRELAAHTRATEQFWKEQWTEGGGKEGDCLARRKDASNTSANVAFGRVRMTRFLISNLGEAHAIFRLSIVRVTLLTFLSTKMDHCFLMHVLMG